MSVTWHGVRGLSLVRLWHCGGPSRLPSREEDTQARGHTGMRHTDSTIATIISGIIGSYPCYSSGPITFCSENLFLWSYAAASRKKAECGKETRLNILPSLSLSLSLQIIRLNKSSDRHQSLTIKDGEDNFTFQNKIIRRDSTQRQHQHLERRCMKLLKSQTTNQTRLSRIIPRRVAPYEIWKHSFSPPLCSHRHKQMK